MSPEVMERIALALEQIAAHMERAETRKRNQLVKTQKRIQTTRSKAADALASVPVTPVAMAAAKRALNRANRGRP